MAPVFVTSELSATSEGRPGIVSHRHGAAREDLEGLDVLGSGEKVSRPALQSNAPHRTRAQLKFPAAGKETSLVLAPQITPPKLAQDSLPGHHAMPPRP